MPKLEMPKMELLDGQQDAEDITDSPDFNPFREKPAKAKTEEKPDEEPGEEEAPEQEEGEEADSEEQTVSDDKDPVFEVPQLGQIRASDIRELVTAAVTFDAERAELDKQRAQLEESYEQLSPAMHVLDLLGHERIRNGFRDLVLEVFKDSDNLSPSDGKGHQFLKDLLPSREQEPENTQLQETVQKLAVNDARREQNDLRRDLAEEFPGVVTREFWESVKAEARQMFAGPLAEHFTTEHLEKIARRAAQAAGKPKSTPKEGEPKLQKGVRLVAGHTTRKGVTQPRLKDPRKMSEQELQEEFVNNSGAFVTEED